MPTTITHADGVEMRVGGTSDDITPFVRRFVWVESLIRGGFFWEMDFLANVWGEWTPLLIGRRPYQFRLKSQEEGQETTTDWRTAITDSSAMSFRGEALLGTVHGGDRRLGLRQKHRTKVWRQRTVSDIVRAVASEYGMVGRADDTSLRYDWCQVAETDWGFLQRIVYESATAGGRGDLFLWVEEDVLKLHAPLLQDASVRRHDLSVAENRVDNVLLTYAGREVDRQGGATIRAVGYDLDAKRAVTFTLGAPQAQTHPALAGRVPRAQEDGVRVFPVTGRSPASVEAHARGRWGRFAPRYFGLRVESRPDLVLRPGTVMELQATLGEDQETPFLGRFLILEVEHEYARGSIKTNAICYRREAFVGEEEPSGVSAENVRSRDRYRAGALNRPRVTVVAEELE